MRHNLLISYAKERLISRRLSTMATIRYVVKRFTEQADLHARLVTSVAEDASRGISNLLRLAGVVSQNG